MSRPECRLTLSIVQLVLRARVQQGFTAEILRHMESRGISPVAPRHRDGRFVFGTGTGEYKDSRLNHVHSHTVTELIL